MADTHASFAATAGGDTGAQASVRHVGRSVRRLEDERLLSGAARWTENVRVEGELHLAVLRSPVAHARLTGVDVAAAAHRAGVVAAFSGRDLADAWVATPPVLGPESAHRPPHLPLATSKLRYVGEPVAVVVAESASAAADALEAVEIEMDVLPAVPEIETAASSRSLLHEEYGTNVAFRFEGRRVGDVDRVFHQADVVVERRFVLPRVMAAAMEPRSTLAIPETDGTLTIHTSTQVPHRIRDHVALVLGLDRDLVRVVVSDVGGGFGPKLESYPEDFLCALAARRLGRPVRFVATRSEDLQATNHGRGQIQHVSVAAGRDGELLGLRVHVTADCGAYLSRVGANVPLNGNAMFPGCYRFGAYQFDAVGVFTTKVPTSAYRGAGRPEATFGIERIIDELAAELGMDPTELRRRNFPSPEEFPFASIGGLAYDSGDYTTALDLAVETVDYGALRAEQARRRADDDPIALGIGFASYVDRCGVGPGMDEFGGVVVDADGFVEVLTGLGPTGQGTVTSLAQIVADQLGIGIEEVRGVHGDTARVESGKGTFGSRSMAVGGVAVSLAAEAVASEARDRAAKQLDVAPEEVDLLDGRCVVRGSPDASVSLFDLAIDERLAAERSYEPETLTFPFGTHVAVVEVDRRTGQVRVRRFVAVDDCGRVINPRLLEGQLAGGLAQGVAEALYEEAAYDADGNLLSGTFVDYLVPGAPDLPSFELLRTVTPSQNPLGVKGVGEAGAIGAPPAVVNAVVDALRPDGVCDVPMPCSPATVWAALVAAAEELPERS